MLTEDGRQETGASKSDSALIGPLQAPKLHVMSYNIRRRVRHLRRRGPDVWSHRKWLIRRLLSTERPTVLSVQEALPDQRAWVLDSLGHGYRSVGHGRNADGSDEGTPIFYDARRLRLTDWSQQALSDTPHQPESRSWGNLLPRILVMAHFTDCETGARFCVLNTHLDHLSAKSRLHSARWLRHLVDLQDTPVILTGDANTHAGSRPYSELTDTGPLRDSWITAHSRLTEDWNTLSKYRPPRRGRRRIDWILVSEGITVHAAGINTARFDGAAASDHEPVQAVLTISPEPA